VKLRDRDAILTQEGLIFRVFGSNHPDTFFICDAEYASEKIFDSKDPRAPRTGLDKTFFKFYNDEGLNLVSRNFPHYTFFYKLLNKKLLGVNVSNIFEIRKPDERLKEIARVDPTDELMDATLRVLNNMITQSGLSLNEFGVFGSMLHGFHHPKFSDIDLVVYGRKANLKMCETLEDLYSFSSSDYSNEFENEDVMKGKLWRFTNFNIREYVWHQKRKQIYGLFKDNKSGRTIKAEFEPVKNWNEINPYYEQEDRIAPMGWTKIKARVTSDVDAPFIPSIYSIEPISVLEGPKCAFEVSRVFSYMEEFRQQVKKDEVIIVEGNLEKVMSPQRSYYQITLTYCPRYYEQVLKVDGLTL
ncbi:nucleotidyltransferase domain-containing protein, partial [Candidatus Bathyarchaeota archaeon]|nr:nucleotidyltransferase domain-containing protein [Candidatus Bathyarchaeota archaeon]